MRRLSAAKGDNSSSPGSDNNSMSTAPYDSPYGSPSFDVAPDASVASRQKALGIGLPQRPMSERPYLSTAYAYDLTPSAAINLDSPDGVIKRPGAHGSSMLSGPGITPLSRTYSPPSAYYPTTAPTGTRNRYGLRFDPLQVN